MTKYICGLCRRGKHLNCSAIGQGITVARHEVRFDKEVPVCVCACFGEFVPKSKQKNYEMDDRQKMTIHRRK